MSALVKRDVLSSCSGVGESRVASGSPVAAAHCCPAEAAVWLLMERLEVKTDS